MGIDTGTTISDSTAVTVEHEELIDQESWAIVPDPFTEATVQDPAVNADVTRDLTDCVVILTSL